MKFHIKFSRHTVFYMYVYITLHVTCIYTATGETSALSDDEASGSYLLTPETATHQSI